MTVDEWLDRVMAARPPLTPAQIAALRPVFAPQIRNAAPAATGAAPATTAATTLEGVTSATR